jgi:Flp pilus assembly protein TadD
MKRSVLNFAVSGLALAVTMVGCKPAATGSHVASASASVPRGDAPSLVAKAQAAARSGNFAAAIPLAERAVELAPQDAGYRQLLGETYLRNGRFQSAASAFTDALSLDPGNARAALSLALAEVATGDSRTAIAQLDSLDDRASPADRGLAYALAGKPHRAIALLEPAAREPHADGRVRQNLAFAYALAGEWEKARAVAAQDISPAELGPRLEQWAAFAQADSGQQRVASLLRITPSQDPGQPERLALVPVSNGTALAAADPAPATPAPAAEPAQVNLASSEAPEWVSARNAELQPKAQAPVEQTRPVYAQAVQSLVAPQPGIARRRAAPIAAVAQTLRANSPSFAQARPENAGRFAVQLGAFSSAPAVERAWASLYKRYGFGDHTPLSTTVSIPGKGKFHRLSVAGFGNRGEADKVCRTVRARGGVCFVRAVAGDAPTQWASRYTTRAG